MIGVLGMSDLNTLVDMYLDVWNEADEEARRAKVERVFTSQATHFTPTGKAVGYDQIFASVSDAYEQGMASGEQKFRSVRDVSNHRGGVRVNWDVTKADGEWVSAGFDCMTLSSDGRVNLDHQFVA